MLRHPDFICMPSGRISLSVRTYIEVIKKVKEKKEGWFADFLWCKILQLLKQRRHLVHLPLRGMSEDLKVTKEIQKATV